MKNRSVIAVVIQIQKVHKTNEAKFVAEFEREKRRRITKLMKGRLKQMDHYVLKKKKTILGHFF